MNIAEKRWKATDKILSDFQGKEITLTEELEEELKDFLDSLKISNRDLNKPITERERHRLNKLIRDSWETIADNDYLAYRVQTRKKKMSFAEYIALMLLLIYCNFTEETFDELKKVFMGVARDAKQQAEEEIGRPPVKPYNVTWPKVEAFLDVPSAGVTLLEYLFLIAMTSSQEAYNLVVLLLNPAIQNGDKLETMLDKHRKRIINIHDGKESGVVVDTARDVWHDVYIEPYREENIQVRFIADIDSKTTMMCKGMDNMLFYTNDWNRYYRWSELDQKDVLYTTFGLKRGENLPPIDNHFHWCRSTISYLIDDKSVQRIRDKTEYNKLVNKLVKYAPKTFELFEKIKYNDNVEYQRLLRLKRVVDKIGDIDKPYQYQNKLKNTFFDFLDDGVELTFHATNRFVGQKKGNGRIILTKDDVIGLLKQKPMYHQGDTDVYYDGKANVIVDRNIGTVVTIENHGKVSKEWEKYD